MVESMDRRPIGARQTVWAQALAMVIANSSVTANQISIGSVVFAFLGSALLIVSAAGDHYQRAAALAGAGCCIQLRLLCNMLDGMVAVEAGKHSKTGALFNELPDRVADSLFLVGAGYACRSDAVGLSLGWAAALLAVLTAYIRAFGAAQGLKQDFSGPMAKPHRMFTLTGACFAGSLESLATNSTVVLLVAMWIIALGTFVTCVRRTLHVADAMNNGA